MGQHCQSRLAQFSMTGSTSSKSSSSSGSSKDEDELIEGIPGPPSTAPYPHRGGNKKTQFQPRLTNPQQQQNNQKQWTGSIPLEKAQYYDEICVKWNQGRCFMNPGNCFTRAGRPLRNCCNYRPVPSNLSIICQKDHACCYFHR
jgi:hypothetical protein